MSNRIWLRSMLFVVAALPLASFAANDDVRISISKIYARPISFKNVKRPTGLSQNAEKYGQPQELVFEGSVSIRNFSLRKGSNSPNLAITGSADSLTSGYRFMIYRNGNRLELRAVSNVTMGENANPVLLGTVDANNLVRVEAGLTLCGKIIDYHKPLIGQGSPDGLYLDYAIDGAEELYLDANHQNRPENIQKFCK